MKDLFSMKDKVVVITGGAGYLGSAMVQGLLEFGAIVMVADTKESKTLQLLSKDYSKLYYTNCDISKTKEVKELFDNTESLHSKIDVLINCATFGQVGGPDSTVECMGDDLINKGLEGSIGQVFRCTREVVPYMEKAGGGSIVNIASMYGMVSPDPIIYGNSGANNPPVYGAGKAAVIQFTRYCAAHLAKKNIRANSICPGTFPNILKEYDNEQSRDFINNLRKKTMLGRVGKPTDIVGAVILLSSEASSYMTGSNIVVDGGWTAW